MLLVAGCCCCCACMTVFQKVFQLPEHYENFSRLIVCSGVVRTDVEHIVYVCPAAVFELTMHDI